MSVAPLIYLNNRIPMTVPHLQVRHNLTSTSPSSMPRTAWLECLFSLGSSHSRSYLVSLSNIYFASNCTFTIQITTCHCPRYHHCQRGWKTKTTTIPATSHRKRRICGSLFSVPRLRYWSISIAPPRVKLSNGLRYWSISIETPSPPKYSWVKVVDFDIDQYLHRITLSPRVKLSKDCRLRY